MTASSPEMTGMEDIMKRLGTVESALSEIKVQVAGIASMIASVMPHLATKSDISELRAELKADIGELRAELKADIGGLRAELKGEIGGLRAELKSDIGGLRAELNSDIGGLRAEVHGREASLLRWLIGTLIASVALACTIAKLVR